MATTSWLVTPAGLSTTQTPWTIGGRRLAHAVDGAAPSDRRVGVVAVGAQDVVDPLGRAEHLVGAEHQHRRLASTDLAGDGALQPWSQFVQRGDDLVVALGPVERVEEHDPAVELGVDVDRGDRDEREALVVDAHQLFGDDLAQRLDGARSGPRVPVTPGTPPLCHRSGIRPLRCGRSPARRTSR
ncbi:MAG: hypothetical protein WKF58_16660 [Ilumatobacteraceae bacterium]